VERASEIGARDPLGRAIRSLISDTGVWVGAVAAAAIVCGSWLATFGLSYLPGNFTSTALGVQLAPGEHVSMGPRLAAAFVAPWVMVRRFAVHSPVASVTFHERGVSLLAAAILIVLILAVGFALRPLIPTLRSRSAALLTCGLASAAAIGIGANLLSYKVGESGTTLHISHPGGATYFVVPLIWLGLVGSFSFGVIRLLHPPLRTTLGAAVTVVGGVALIAAIAFPIVVISWKPYALQGKNYWSDDLAMNIAHWAAGVSAPAVPLAFGARAHLAVTREFTPFRATASEATGKEGANLRLPRLQRYMEQHPTARLLGYAGVGGGKVKGAALVLAVLLLAVLVMFTVAAVMHLGAPTALAGMRHGLGVGLGCFVVLLLLKWLTPSVYTLRASLGTIGTRFALDTGPLFQIGGEMLALTGIAGLLAAAIHPSSYRYEPARPHWPRWMPGRVATFAEASRAEETAGQPDAGTMSEHRAATSAPFCMDCGREFVGDERFCPSCGTQRSPL
jgi:hypothetical protein